MRKFMVVGQYVANRQDDNTITVYCRVTHFTYKFDANGSSTQGSPYKGVKRIAKMFAKSK